MAEPIARIPLTVEVGDGVDRLELWHGWDGDPDRARGDLDLARGHGLAPGEYAAELVILRRTTEGEGGTDG